MGQILMKLNKQYNHIYVICPPNYRTGGVELLHQLVFALSQVRDNIHCVYDGLDTKDYDIVEDYKKYVTDFLVPTEIDDDSNNLVIVPEINISFLKKFKNIDKAVYWESVDNFFFHNFSHLSIKYYRNSYTFMQRLKEYGHIIKRFRKITFQTPKSTYMKSIEYHFCQSDYALNKCNSWGYKNVFMLTDYLNNSFIDAVTEMPKEDIVLYNPSKGYKITKKIIEQGKDIKFVALQNLTSDEVKNYMSRAKVYIDFGNHPGKDRMPREACVSGCCMLTGTQGSANRLYSDVSISNNYKFDKPIKEIQEILGTIRYMIKNYNNVYVSFDSYVNKIKNEEKQFFLEVKEIFS